MAPSAARGWGMSVGHRHHRHVPLAGQAAPARRRRSPRPAMAPASKASAAASTVSSVSPENDMANTSEPVPTKSGRLVALDHRDRDRHERARPPPPARRRRCPLPPMPSTTTFSTCSRLGQARRGRGRPPTAASTCSGRPAVASHMSSVSRASGDGGRSGRAIGRVTAPALPVADAAGVGLGHQPVVLGVVDRGRLVDQHDRDAVAHRVAAVQARVVEPVLVGEVQQRALVLGAGQHLDAAVGRASSVAVLSRSYRGAGVGRRSVTCARSAARQRRARRRSSASTSATLGGVRRRLGVGCLDVEPEQRLGVGRAQVEPPVAAVDGQPVEAVDRAERPAGRLDLGGQQLDGAGRVVAPRC